MTNNDDILTVAGLNVAYGESKALFDISMNVRPNQVVACVGRNGAGKSTMLKSIAGFLKPTSGTIVSGGTNLVGRPPTPSPEWDSNTFRRTRRSSPI